MTARGAGELGGAEHALADGLSDLPDAVREMGAPHLEQIARLAEVVERLADELEAASKTDVELRRLCTVPGVGPAGVGAIAAFAPDMPALESGRTFAATRGNARLRRDARGCAASCPGSDPRAARRGSVTNASLTWFL